MEQIKKLSEDTSKPIGQYLKERRGDAERQLKEYKEWQKQKLIEEGV